MSDARNRYITALKSLYDEYSLANNVQKEEMINQRIKRIVSRIRELDSGLEQQNEGKNLTDSENKPYAEDKNLKDIYSR